MTIYQHRVYKCSFKGTFSLIILICFISQIFFEPWVQAYTVEKLSDEEAFSRSLGRDWIYTTADDDGQGGATAHMIGVINAPPEEVWELYIKTNDYKDYKIPTLRDSRTLAPLFVQQYGQGKDRSRDVNEFYQKMANLSYDPLPDRRIGAQWEAYAFQFYDIPWPAENKWLINHYKHDERRRSEAIFHTEHFLVGGNVLLLDGKVTLKPFDGDPRRTVMDYQIHVNTGYHVPRFLLVWGAKTAMPRVIRAIRRHLKKIHREELTAEDRDE